MERINNKQLTCFLLKTLAVIVLFWVFFYTSRTIVYAQTTSASTETQWQKDSDYDGIPDNLEISKFHTDPTKSDTDGDGYYDFQEILDKSNPNSAMSTPLSKYKNTTVDLSSPNTPIAWYIGRIAGIVSFIMFTITICLGLSMTSKILLKYRIISAPNALEAHSFNAAYVAFSFLILHILALVFDNYIKLKLENIFIPFSLNKNLTTAIGFNIRVPVSLGVFAFYISIILITTSRLKNKLISAKHWRTVHYLSFLFYIMFLLHGITSGSDTREPWMIIIYASSVLMVLTMILLRVFGKKYFMPKPKVLPNNPTNTTSPKTGLEINEKYSSTI
jgi:methionine sulfoxide reductase heme-binding subunit